MIRLDKTITGNQTLSFSLSLNTKRIVNKSTTNYFFMKIENDMNKELLYVYPTEVGSYAPRYANLSINALNETTTTTPNIVSGEIRFKLEGYHKYTVYNVLNTRHTDDSGISSSIIEQGKLYYATVQQEEVTYSTYTPLPENNDNILNNNTVYLKI